MQLDLRSLSESERHVIQTTAVFLQRRLRDRSTIEWALGLGQSTLSERFAISELLDREDGRRLAEPWRSTWRLIAEQWEEGANVDSSGLAKLRIQRRIKEQERGTSLVNGIVDLVRPRIQVKPRTTDYGRDEKPRPPRTVSDLVSASLTSGPLVRPYEIALTSIKDKSFLLELAQALDASVNQGLAMARRIGWDGKEFWRIGDLRRAYFREKDLTSEPDQIRDRDDPDDFHEGIAPCVKLLYAVVSELGKLSSRDAALFASQWLAMGSAVHIRLWAALARDGNIISGGDVSDFLVRRRQEEFWRVLSFPEIAELRACRFNDLPSPDQTRILQRLRRGPPRSLWGNKVNAADIDSWRKHWAVRELRRVEIAGGKIPSQTQSWIAEQLLTMPDIQGMSKVDEDFPSGIRIRGVSANPDHQYDGLAGEERLAALEAALSEPDDIGHDGSSQRAADWMRLPGRPASLLGDLVTATVAGQNYPKIWSRFGWAHRPVAESAEVETPEQQDQARSVLQALSRMELRTAEQAIDGICNWLFDWAQVISSMNETALVFLKLWPIAASATENGGDGLIYRRNAAAESEYSEEAIELNTLSAPIGLLMQVFILAFHSVSEVSAAPFDDHNLKAMRDVVMGTTGRAGLVTKYRLLEYISYFTVRAPDWAKNYLAPLVLKEDNEALTLWLAVAKRPLPSAVLRLIGLALCQRALDIRLPRDIRSAFVTALIVDSFHALLNEESPVVSYAQVQQVLRMLDDEVRASAAGDVKQLVLATSSNEGRRVRPEEVFAKAVQPFFRNVWPQERSLTTPGVARNLADLPATCGGAFPDCVALIIPFLVPFDCWSLHDVGVDDRDDALSLERIESMTMADSMLNLLDAVIGNAERSVVPHDLGDALERIATVAPKLTATSKFQRLKLLGG